MQIIAVFLTVVQIYKIITQTASKTHKNMDMVKMQEAKLNRKSAPDVAKYRISAYVAKSKSIYFNET